MLLLEFSTDCGVAEGPPLYLLLPKLHTERSCIVLHGAPAPKIVNKSLRRKAKPFFLTVNAAFDEVGPSWISEGAEYLYTFTQFELHRVVHNGKRCL